MFCYEIKSFITHVYNGINLKKQYSITISNQSINMKTTTILGFLAFLGVAILVEAAIEEKALEWKRKCLVFLEELFNHFAMKVQIGQAAVGRWMELMVPTF